MHWFRSEVSLPKVVRREIAFRSGACPAVPQQPWRRTEEGIWSGCGGWGRVPGLGFSRADSAEAEWWGRIKGDNSRAERGVREQSRPAQARQHGFVWVLWLYARIDDFRNARDVISEHWESRERKMGRRPMD